ncbi:MAG: hypothetical protein E7252_03210 [Lachnospira sp.]|nr:hypothetical protein [Lachnospira sp.]
MKKIGKVIIITIFALIATFMLYRLGMRIYNHFTYDPDLHQTESIEYINEKGAVVYVYGKTLQFHESLKYNTVENIEFVSEDIKANYVYLIINDFDGDVTFDEEDLKYLTDFADEHIWFNYIYIGRDKLPMIDKYFIDNKKEHLSFTDDMSMSYVVDNGQRGVITGIWSESNMQYLEKNEDLLEELIVLSIKNIIQSNEE